MNRETLHVLILEPNVLQCDLLRVALTRNGMKPITCNEPGTLRGQLLEHRPDVLLIDTYLPGQNGLELISQLTLEGLLEQTRVFFISSMGYPEIVQKAVKLGASGFLVKPLNPDMLVTRILKCFNQPVQLLPV
jgi:DNA-binding NtrC family response regulator